MSSVLDWLVGLMRTIGAPGVGFATALETVFPPVPSEAVLPLAGYTASQGHYGLVAAIAWATAGSLVGALVLYYAGARLGAERLAGIAERIPLVYARDVDRAMGWFDRHGRTAVLVGRLVPGVRSLISVPAGVSGMPLLQFAGFTTAGSLVWNGLLIGAGYALGEQWHLVESRAGEISDLVYVVIAAVVVWFVVRRWRGRRRAGR
ncbi:DedA family protein [Nocardioides sp. cx-169]|uniref:DedA family protein n=1 Tax=Nocardioides sp. cx-169 TaxID=2899080 RepID=UPI001E3D59B3|nr:DedA family protein [Nocardioides sp. cx-169]MCD4532976.1 DedA family protein [Nocardioides sp. cx-169]